MPRSERRNSIESYYRQTWFDYSRLWMNGRNLAFHFGYQGEGRRTHADSLLNTNRVLAERVAIKPGERVLDAGCGVGGSARWLARERGAWVVGINLVKEHAARSGRMAGAPQPLGGACFATADYTRTPFRDASFDVVWAVESLCHAEDKGRFYREASRLLRPGGRLVVAEYLRAQRGLPAREEALVREWLSGWAIPDLDTAGEHARHALDAGLVDLRLDDFTPRTRRSLRRLYRIARACQPFATAAHQVGLRTRIQNENVIAAVRQYQALQRGLWFYGVLSARKPPEPAGARRPGRRPAGGA